MADNWTRNIVCGYFKNGICIEGNNCRYRHVQGNRQDDNTNTTVTPSTPLYQVTCRYFQHGICKFGSQCHFRHILENGENNSNNSNSSESNTSESQASNTSTSTSFKNIADNPRLAEEWAQAPEFEPSCNLSMAGSSFSTLDEANSLGSSAGNSVPLTYAQAVSPAGKASSLSLEPLCPYIEATGMCNKTNCTYLHGDICDFCNTPALHPYNYELRKSHISACVKKHEVDMELSFAIQRSRKKSCGVCLEIVMEKKSRERRFGILPNCNHCFCLTCIRKWRQVKHFDNKIIRTCPECRVASDFVCPSVYWVDTKEEKEKLIKDYKGALSTKDCKYFNKGHGQCPFGNKCFYLHVLPDGTKIDVGPPIRQRQNADADFEALHQLLLWDYFAERNGRWVFPDTEDIDPFFFDAEDSDDPELYF